ncbi:MAG: hypothetical protein KBA66_12705 [Leptospiraceae bacterium]|nr:hypothetical protein [Leptospiraceae bacterium]
MNRNLLNKPEATLIQNFYGINETHAFQTLQSYSLVKWDQIDEFAYHFLDEIYEKRLKLAEMDFQLVLSIYRLGNRVVRKGIMRLLEIEYKNDFTFAEEDHLKFYFALYKKNIRGLIFGEEMNNKSIDPEEFKFDNENDKSLFEDLIFIFQCLDDTKSLSRVGGTYLPKCMPDIKPIELKNAIEKWQRLRVTKMETEVNDKFAEIQKEVRLPGSIYDADKYYLFIDLRAQLAREWNQMVMRI